MAKETKTHEVKAADTKLEGWDWSISERNLLVISEELKQEIKDQGLEFRFINASQFREKGNSHHNQWRPYNVKSKAPLELMKGITPEGVLLRGDLVLAVRPKRLGDEYRRRLDDKRQVYKGFNRAKADEMRALSREHKVDKTSKVFEGYDEN